jgi:hypothetical protein
VRSADIISIASFRDGTFGSAVRVTGVVVELMFLKYCGIPKMEIHISWRGVIVLNFHKTIPNPQLTIITP